MGILVIIINAFTMFSYLSLQLQLDDFCGQRMKQQEELILYADEPIPGFSPIEIVEENEISL
jgi:hypothetical protein